MIDDSDRVCWNCTHVDGTCPYEGKPYTLPAKPCDSFTPDEGFLNFLAECAAIEKDHMEESSMWKTPTEVYQI